MSEQERAASERLQSELRNFYDNSLVEPIEVGDPLHRAIEAYRESRPDRHLSTTDAEFMRDMLALSRYKDRDTFKQFEKRRESQAVAGKWDDLLEARYGEPGAIPPETLDKLTPAQAACALALTDAPQRTDVIATIAGLRDSSTARKALPALARMNPPLAKKTPRGYVRVRPK